MNFTDNKSLKRIVVRTETDGKYLWRLTDFLYWMYKLNIANKGLFYVDTRENYSVSPPKRLYDLMYSVRSDE